MNIAEAKEQIKKIENKTSERNIEKLEKLAEVIEKYKENFKLSPLSRHKV